MKEKIIMRKKIISILTSIIIAATFIPVVSFAAQTEDDEPDAAVVGSEELQDEVSDQAVDISSMSLKLNEVTWFYTGAAIRPEATIDGLIEDQDYTLSYKDNDKIGTATVTATGIGNYRGETSASFEIVETVISSVVCSPGSVIYVNNSLQIKPEIIHPKGKTKYTSKTPSVATVSSTGKVTGKKPGKCLIIVKNNDKSYKVAITVKKPALSKSSVVVYNSDTYKLKVLGGSGKIKWKSSNKKVVTVSSKGVVKGKKAGKCTITAKRGKYTMKCKVRVPSNYEGYSIPDFGAAYGITGSYSSEEDLDMMAYKAKKSYIKKYRTLLKKKGFAFYDKEEGVYSYVNDNDELVVFIYEKGIIVVGYGNIPEGDEDDYDDSYDNYGF